MQAFAPLRIALYRRLWITSVFFGVGHTLQVVAGNWLMLELTGSPLWVGLMVASPHLPLLLLAIPSGAMADIIDRRRVLMLSAALMGLSAVGMAGLYVVDALTPWRLLSLGILVGIGIAFYVPAWQASISNLVPAELLAPAISLNSASGAVAMSVGPALGGALVAAFGFAVPATVAAVGYGILFASLLSVRRVQWRDDAGTAMRTAMATGLRYVRFSAGYRWLLLVAAAFGASSAALRAMLPSITEDRLLAGASTYGLLLGAMGVGALVGALVREQAVLHLRRRLVPVAVAAYGVMGLAVGLSRSLAVTMLALAVAGVAWTWTLTTLNSTFHRLAPAWVRARAMSIYILALFGLVPIGTIAAGLLGDLVGASTALIVSSVAVLALAVAILRRPLVEIEDRPAPEPVGTRPTDGHPTVRSDQRVLVSTVWTVERARLAEYVEAMEAMRRIRMRTGAFRWTLYRDVVRPLTFTEVFEIHTWEQHLQQHERLDAEAFAVIRRAISFDVAGGPRSTHMVGVDRATVEDLDWSSVDLAEHDELHRRDGSIAVATGTGTGSPAGPEPTSPPEQEGPTRT